MVYLISMQYSSYINNPRNISVFTGSVWVGARPTWCSTTAPQSSQRGLISLRCSSLSVPSLSCSEMTASRSACFHHEGEPRLKYFSIRNISRNIKQNCSRWSGNPFKQKQWIFTASLRSLTSMGGST